MFQSNHVDTDSRPTWSIIGDYMIKVRKGRPPRNDLTGQTFGFLKVEKMAQTEKSLRGSWRAICTCTLCGKTGFDTYPTRLLSGDTTSCGCRKDHYEKFKGNGSHFFKGCGDISANFWYRTKARAKLRGHEVSITIEELWDLYQKQEGKCALTGLPINISAKSPITASLDRIDSRFGYVKGNVQWVLKPVNVMKNSFPMDYFISICNKIAHNCDGKPILTDADLIVSNWNHNTRKSVNVA